MFSGDAHRKSGVYQLWFGSKPGGVMLPPELKELRPHVYSSVGRNASAESENRADSGGKRSRRLKLFYEKRLAQLVAADERFHGAIAPKEILNLAILINFLCRAQ